MGVVFLTGCGVDTDGRASAAAPPSALAPPVLATSTPTTTAPTTTAPAATAPAATSTTSATSTTTTTTAPPAPPAPPAPRDCSGTPVVVFGNSTDSVTGTNLADLSNAWPAYLQVVMSSDPRLRGVTIRNNAKPGVTMHVPNPWSDAPGQRWTADIPVLFADVPPEQRAGTVVILAPSIIDLQLLEGDVDTALLGFFAAVEQLRGLGIGTILTLPMNPIVEDSLMRFTYPWLPERMQEFNDRLDEQQLLLYPTSPIARDDVRPALGDPVFYDDFRGIDLQGAVVEPDGMHIDTDGAAEIALTLGERLGDLLAQVCAEPACCSRLKKPPDEHA